jgi:alpha-tubulin suppressor-like RCC1 family protein
MAPAHAWTEIEVGPSFAMAIRTDGTLWCWGTTGNGQCGGQYVWRADVPTLIDENTWTRVSADAANACGIRRDGTLWCWRYSGHLGAPMTAPADPPTQIGSGRSWSEVRVGGLTCALDVGGAAWCWVLDGQIYSRVPVQVQGF